MTATLVLTLTVLVKLADTCHPHAPSNWQTASANQETHHHHHYYGPRAKAKGATIVEADSNEEEPNQGQNLTQIGSNTLQTSELTSTTSLPVTTSTTSDEPTAVSTTVQATTSASWTTTTTTSECFCTWVPQTIESCAACTRVGVSDIFLQYQCSAVTIGCPEGGRLEVSGAEGTWTRLLDEPPHNLRCLQGSWHLPMIDSKQKISKVRCVSSL